MKTKILKKQISFDKTKFLEAIKYLGIFVVLWLSSISNINFVVYPFSIGLMFALVWCDQKIYIILPLFVLAKYLSTFALFDLFGALFVAIVLSFCYFIHVKTKKPIKKWQLGVYCLISQALPLYFGVVSSSFFVYPIIEVMLSVAFMFACVQVFSAIIVRGFASKLTVGEIICGAVILLALSGGVYQIDIFGFELIKLFATIIILLSAYTFNITTSIVCGGIMGMGTLLSSNVPVYLSAFILWAFAVSVFKLKNRIIPCIALLLCEVAIGLYFNIYYSYSIINLSSVLAGCVIFLAIPGKAITELSGFFSTNADRLAMRNIVNRSRSSLSRRLLELSDVFAEMDKVFRAMIAGGLSESEAKDFLVGEVKERTCKSCSEFNTCHRTYASEMEEMFSEFVSAGLKRGKASLLEVPPFLASRCGKTNHIINVVNEVTTQYKKYAGMMAGIDASKVLIAEQLSGVSGIMKQLSKEVESNISFDAGRESKIIDELTYNNVICSDAVIYEQNKDIVCGTVIVKNESINVSKIEKCVSKVCNHKMVVVGQEVSPRAGWTILSLKTAPKFDIVFGTASQTKANSDMSGDSYSLIRIENDKFMLALCDGMGSGVKAERSSNLAIGLVENFYKAGFDNEIILSSVNKLLALGNDEVFSALDLCVVDLKKGVADLIKLGAPNGFIKHTNGTETIEMGALPLGILNQAEPSLKKVVLLPSDMVVLCTDGINDSFMSNQDLCDYISESETTNPQLLAEEILGKALENCKGVALDDMTVIVARVFNRV